MVFGQNENMNNNLLIKQSDISGHMELRGSAFAVFAGLFVDRLLVYHVFNICRMK